MMHFDFLHDSRPEYIDRLLSARLPQRLYVVTAVFATVLGTIAAAGAIESLRVRSALLGERRIERRFEASREALSAAQLEWRQLDALVSRDRRLRDIRLSGTEVAARIARVGNAFPPRAWVTSMSAAPSNYALKARAVDLPAVQQVLTNLVSDRVIAQPRGDFRLSREDAGRAGSIAFEIGADFAP
jgi:hypothetical protein